MCSTDLALRDLQSLLRRSLGLNNVLIEDVKTGMLVPLGENYGSTILKVCATVKTDENALPEQLHLIAKMLPPTEYQQVVFDSNYTIPKEIFLYEQLFPMYQELEKEMGLNPIFDILPKFYGARLSLKEDAKVVDEDAVILLENLKERGFYVANRKLGLDLEHAKFVIKALARFHTLGIAMKNHKPKEFAIIKHRAKCMTTQTKGFNTIILEILKQIEAEPELVDYLDSCRVALTDNTEYWRHNPQEPWATIIHTDFWVTNFLFHKNSNNQIDDVKFIDFQNYLYLSPLRDLAFFLGISLKAEVEKNHYEELVDLYYNEFIYWLEILKCDTTPFSRQKFNQKLLEDGKIEFMHCTFMLKIQTTEVDSNIDKSQIKDLIWMKGNKLFMINLINFIKSFAKRGWL